MIGWVYYPLLSGRRLFRSGPLAADAHPKRSTHSLTRKIRKTVTLSAQPFSPLICSKSLQQHTRSMGPNIENSS